MADYQSMYLTLARQTEKAIRILIAAQRSCEECYLATEEAPVLSLLEQSQEEP